MGVDNTSFLSKFIDMLMLDNCDPSDWDKYHKKIEVSKNGLLKLNHDTELKVLWQFINNSHVDLYGLIMSELHNSTYKPLSDDDDDDHTHPVSVDREGSKKNGVVSLCSVVSQGAAWLGHAAKMISTRPRLSEEMLESEIDR
ncbi:hypothetical protein CsSME_00048948 [Camellia sinensis var. sinensis]